MALQIPKLELLNDEDRLFKSIITAEVIDKDGEFVPISEFKRPLNNFMDRGGTIIDAHSNRVTGKVLNWIETTHKGKPAVEITGKIFKDYTVDDDVWKAIKSGRYGNMSFGGRNKDSEKEDNYTTLKDLEIYEMSLCESPSNPLANVTDVNYLAKSDLDKDEVVKPFAGYSDFNDCVSQNKDKGDPEAYCASIKRNVEKLAYSEYLKSKELGGKDMEKQEPSEAVVAEVEDASVEATDAISGLKEAVAMLTEEVKAINAKLGKDGDEDEEEPEKKPDEMHAEPDEEDEDEEKTKDETTELDLKGQGEDVTLPKAVSAQAPEAEQEVSEETDEVKLIEKITKKVTSDLKKSLKIGGETPRNEVAKMAPAELLKSSDIAYEIAKGNKNTSWADINRMVRTSNTAQIGARLAGGN